MNGPPLFNQWVPTTACADVPVGPAEVIFMEQLIVTSPNVLSPLTNLPDGAFVSGRPAHDHHAELRQQVRIRNLDKVYARVEALERRAKVQ